MLTVDEAIARLRGAARVLPEPETVTVIGARARVLAADVVALIDVPPADNSAMDGYALRRADWPGPGHPMAVSQRIAAGLPPQPLAPGTAARIFTGAELPDGADTVVIQEDTESGSGDSVVIRELAEKGANIRPRGQDIAAGQTILCRGRRLRAQELGQIASLGLREIQCYRRLRVALLSTGDELTEPGERAGPAQIYNSNRYAATGLLEGWGFEVVNDGIVRDDPGKIAEALEQAAANADVVVTSGGVSVGEEDHVRDVVDRLGKIDLWKVAVKPGKPFAFGQVRGKPFLGLPGNPVSVFVTLLIIARPFLMDSQGAVGHEPRPVAMPAAFDKLGTSREDYLRVRVTPAGLELFPTQSSGVLTSLCWGDGLARQRIGQDIGAGDPVDFFPFEAMF